MTGSEIVRFETDRIERLVALGVGRFEAVQAVDAGVDPQAVESLVSEQGLPVGVALQLAR